MTNKNQALAEKYFNHEQYNYTTSLYYYMASSTLLYIAWPVTIGLSFMAGSMILSKESTPENSKNGNQSSKVSHRTSSSNGSTNENSADTNRRALTARAGEDGYTKSYDIKGIANTNNPLERMAKLLRMIPQLGPGDFEQVIADFRELDMTPERLAEYRILLSAWAKINPEGALAYAKENTTTSLANNTILSTWAGYAPDAAVQWVKLNHEGDKANPYLLAIIKGITNSNPEGATVILQSLPSSMSYVPLKGIATQISKLGIEKSNLWLATIKDEKLRTSATHKLVYPLAKKDPQATIDWLKTLPENILNASAGSVARAWAEQDIDKAAEWTSSLKGETRTRAARQMIGQFVSSDPNKAEAWMKTMSEEPDYKNIVRSFINSAQADHPELVLANLDQIGDTHGQYTKQFTLAQWAAKDKDAATKWMQNNNMDNAAQQKVNSLFTDLMSLGGKGGSRGSRGSRGSQNFIGSLKLSGEQIIKMSQGLPGGLGMPGMPLIQGIQVLEMKH